MYDILIKNARLIDGTGTPAIARDLAVSGSRIAAIGNLTDSEAANVIHADGKVLCPGFIDAHGHSDFTLFVNHQRALAAFYNNGKSRIGVSVKVIIFFGYS